MTSKLISSTVWSLCSILAACLSFGILAVLMMADMDLLEQLPLMWSIIREAFARYNMEFWEALAFSGVVIFARTSKALARLNAMFQKSEVKKTYHAIVEGTPQPETAELQHWLVRNEKQNKAYVAGRDKTGAKLARLDYALLSKGENYSLVEVHLHTGRHHQIRCQLSAIGCPVKGDLKYGARRSNPDGSICLHARHIRFEHPVSHQIVEVTAPYPETLPIWRKF